jgi:hypothetical protein
MTDNSEMMKVLETIADRLVDIHLSNGRQFDELNRKLEALLALKADDQLSLFAMVAAAPASVVPNEDEAMPVLASCPSCNTKAYTEAGIADFFGWRTPAGRPTIVQSWCRECRSAGKDQASARTKLPDSVTKFWREADALRKQADAKRCKRAEVLEASRGRENKESVELLIEEHDLRIEVRKLIAEYDKARRAFRKNETSETGEN